MSPRILEAAAKEVRQAGAVQPLLRALFTEERLGFEELGLVNLCPQLRQPRHPASTGPNLVAEAALAMANFASVDALLPRGRAL